MQLFGRFREFHAAPEITLDLPGIATVAEFRAAFDAWAGAHWPGYAPPAEGLGDRHRIHPVARRQPAARRWPAGAAAAGERRVSMRTDPLHDPRIACHVVDMPTAGWTRRRRSSSSATTPTAASTCSSAACVHPPRTPVRRHPLRHFDPWRSRCSQHRRGGGRRLRPEGEVLRRPRPRQAGGRRPAVVIAFGTPHRDEAFRGCREVIEAVKHQAPIWKQEHFIDGHGEWSEGCSLCGQDEHGHADSAGVGHAHAGLHRGPLKLQIAPGSWGGAVLALRDLQWADRDGLRSTQLTGGCIRKPASSASSCRRTLSRAPLKVQRNPGRDPGGAGPPGRRRRVPTVQPGPIR